MLAFGRALRVASFVALVSIIATPQVGSAAPVGPSGFDAAPAIPACYEIPRVAYYDSFDGHTWFETQRIRTIVGSEIVRSIGIIRNDYEQMTLLDACGQAVTHDPAYYGTAGAATTWELTSRPPCAGLPPSDPSWCGEPGVFTGFPTVPSCSVTNSAVECVWYQYFSTLNFVTEVGGAYVLTVSVAGFHPLNLCIDADTNIASVATLTDPVCAQAPVDPVFSGQASPDIDAGGLISDSVTLSGINPGGSLEFNLYGPDDPTCSTLIHNEVVPVTGSGVYHSADQTPTATGTYRWTVEYTGDTNNPQNNPASLPCNSANQSVDVSPLATTTTVESSANPSVVGQQVTFTATVAGVGGSATPTGSVQFTIGGLNAGGPVALDANGQAQLTLPFKARRSRIVAATYGGDSIFDGSTSSQLRQVVRRAATNTAVLVSPNPGSSGALFTLTATVTPIPPGAGVPGSRVRFFVDGVPVTHFVKLVAGQATVQRKLLLSVGIHEVTARYAGGGRFRSSVSPAFELTIN